MSALLRHLRLKPLPATTLRRYSTQQQQQPPTYQPPSPTTSAATTIPPPPPPSENTSSETNRQPNAHREFYRSGSGRAVAWNFLVAMATFQVLYLGWLKLESMEVKKMKRGEVEEVEAEAKKLVGRK